MNYMRFNLKLKYTIQTQYIYYNNGNARVFGPGHAKQ